jgi:hypothetical protein
MATHGEIQWLRPPPVGRINDRLRGELHGRRRGLALRYDGGSCFRSEHYQVEIDHLGIARSPAYHYEPETNGCAEKFIQTLKEQVLWIERFETFEDLRAAVRKFTVTYNREWLLERHGYHTHRSARAPAQSGTRGMISLFTRASGEPGAGAFHCPVARQTVTRDPHNTNPASPSQFTSCYSKQLLATNRQN